MASLKPGPIGPSTGWLSAKLDTSLDTHMRVLKRAGATAAEMNASPDRFAAMLAGNQYAALDYRSIHLPSFGQYTSDAREDVHGELQNLLSTLGRITSQHQLQGAAIHPDVTPAHLYEKLQQNGIPVALENMDRLKPTAKSVDELRALGNSHCLPYVLDVQHAYENSKDNGGDGVDLSRDLAEMMIGAGDIQHLHVSGEINQHGKQLVMHAQLHTATNRKEILNALGEVLKRSEKPLPIILEGEYLLSTPYNYQPRDAAERLELEEQCADDIRREIECVFNALNV